MLRADKLNLAGEFHSESKARVDDERLFCVEKAGTTDYWTEAEFPVVPEGGRYANTGDPAADLMEYRAAHGAALLVARYDKLGDRAISVSALSAKDAPLPVADINTEIQKLKALRARIDGTWRYSDPEVDTAVRSMYQRAEQAFGVYDTAFTGASLQNQQAAIRKFANSRVDLRDLLPALATAVGADVQDNRSGADVAAWMRVQRSRFMGIAAAHSGIKKGVWKVGEGHIDDLVSGRANVRMTDVNIVTREQFNTEYAAWKAG
jgi:hypothetical protein